MNLENRISAFVNLGTYITHLPGEEKENIVLNVRQNNSWFTDEMILDALQGIAFYLNEKDLRKWLANYKIIDTKPQKVGVVMAGNIPGVGFHDFLCVLLSGNVLYAKLSSQDEVLIKILANMLLEIEPMFQDFIHFVEKMNEAEAIIATGSDNTSRYFEYYFSKIPHLLRKNRTGIGVLTGEETNDELYDLGKDIFQYLGLGCRNVSKLYVPENYDFTPFFEAIQPFEKVRMHHKYMNNYDYNRSIYLVNQTLHLDNGFLVVTENENVISPMSVIYYEKYKIISEIQLKLIENQEKIQCIVSKNAWISESIPFGNAQKPSVWDYADGVDTMNFLLNINQ